MEQTHLCKFGRQHHEEQFCENILNMEQWFRRICRLKVFIIWSSVALLFSGAELFVHFCKRHFWKGTIFGNYFEFGPVVHEEMSLFV